MPPETTVMKADGNIWRIIGPGHYRCIKNVKAGIDYSFLTDWTRYTLVRPPIDVFYTQQKE